MENCRHFWQPDLLLFVSFLNIWLFFTTFSQVFREQLGVFNWKKLIAPVLKLQKLRIYHLNFILQVVELVYNFFNFYNHFTEVFEMYKIFKNFHLKISALMAIVVY